jgi:serine/threonine protein kinase
MSEVSRQIGPYQILSVLKPGAHFTVYRALASNGLPAGNVANGSPASAMVSIPTARREVALKVRNEPGFTDLPKTIADTLRRFKREAEILGMLNHPNIVQFISASMDSEPRYVATALQAKSLQHLLKASGRLPFEQTAEIVRQIASALAYVHSLNIIHRDVTVNNILIGYDNVVRLADFDNALFKGENIEIEKTKTTAFAGTQSTRAPEQHAGFPEYGSDQYSLGCVWYQLLTGQFPFEEEHPSRIANLRQTREIELPDGLLPEDLKNIWTRCVQKDSQNRYVTCNMVALKIQKWQKDREAQEARASGVEVPRKTPGWQPRIRWSLLGGLLLVGAAVAALWLGQSGITKDLLSNQAESELASSAQEAGQAPIKPPTETPPNVNGEGEKKKRTTAANGEQKPEAVRFGRSYEWGGRQWMAKSGQLGGQHWSDDPKAIQETPDKNLKLDLTASNGVCKTLQLFGPKTVGYGQYDFEFDLPNGLDTQSKLTVGIAEIKGLADRMLVGVDITRNGAPMDKDIAAVQLAGKLPATDPITHPLAVGEFRRCKISMKWLADDLAISCWQLGSGESKKLGWWGSSAGFPLAEQLFGSSIHPSILLTTLEKPPQEAAKQQCVLMKSFRFEPVQVTMVSVPEPKKDPPKSEEKEKSVPEEKEKSIVPQPDKKAKKPSAPPVIQPLNLMAWGTPGKGWYATWPRPTTLSLETATTLVKAVKSGNEEAIYELRTDSGSGFLLAGVERALHSVTFQKEGSRDVEEVIPSGNDREKKWSYVPPEQQGVLVLRVFAMKKAK